MRIEDAVQKQNITESTHNSLLIAHRLLEVYRAMEVVLMDAIYAIFELTKRVEILQDANIRVFKNPFVKSKKESLLTDK